MKNLPDFSAQGYRVIHELGHNLNGGRVTYLASAIASEKRVVIKEFQFARVGSDWSGYKAFEREVQILQSLHHSGIPRYLHSFETPSGFCMVQEYKDAKSLAMLRTLTPAQIKQIAIATLEILAYLQQQIPVIIHRDIKPSNLLVDDQLNVYLVDFGLARIGGPELGMSSVAAGTFGFMSPEQLYNRSLSEATDLYALGATIICLVTGIEATAIDTLIDEDNRINFKSLVPKLSLGFIAWLEKMVQPKKSDRYPSAAVALAELKPLEVLRLPEVELSQKSLQVKLLQPTEQVVKTITIRNSVPDTILEGRWEVLPDSQNSSEFSGSIAIVPAEFASNEIQCQIILETEKLAENSFYKYQLQLNANSLEKNHVLPLEISTVYWLKLFKDLPYTAVGMLLLFSVGAVAILIGTAIPFTQFLAARGAVTANLMGGLLGFLAGFTIGLINRMYVVFAVAIAFLTLSVFVLGVGAAFAALQVVSVILVMALLGFAAGLFVDDGWKQYQPLNQFLQQVWQPLSKEFGSNITSAIAIFGLLLGIILGIAFNIGLSQPFILLALTATSLPLVGLMLYLPVQRSRLLMQDRDSKPDLIKS